MTSSLYIAGTNYTAYLVRESIIIMQESSFKNSSLSFMLRNLSVLPSVGDVVEFYDDTTLIFGGQILSIDNDSLLPEKMMQVACTDWYSSLLGQLVRRTYNDYQFGDMIRDIIATRVLDADLKCMLQFEETSGTEAADSTKYENPATLVGGVTWDTTNHAIDLDGEIGSYMSVEDNANIDFSGSFSVCIEFVLTNLGVILLHKTDTANPDNYSVEVGATGIVTFRINSDATEYTVVTDEEDIIVEGQQHTIVCVHNAALGLGYIYVDGVLVGSDTTTTDPLDNTDGPLITGFSTGEEGWNMSGKIYRISLYSRALSAEEARRWDIDILEVKAPNRLIVSYGTPIVSAVFAYEWPADVLTRLCTELGLSWRIDEHMFINVYDMSSGTPVATLTEGDGVSFLNGTLVVNKDISQVRNAVFVRGGVYGAAWQYDALLTNGTDTVFALPYKYEGFEMFTDTVSLCSDVISWFKMQEASGNLADSKGSNTLTAANLTYSQAGQIGNSIDFNGTTSSARKTSATHPTGNGAHSMCIWVRPDTFDTTERYLMGFGVLGAEGSSLSIIVVDGIYYLRHRCNGETNDVEIGDITGGTWHHIGMTYNPDAAGGALLTLYHGGAILDEFVIETVPAIVASGVVEIGGNNGSNVFDGRIDESIIFDYSLSEQEMFAISSFGGEAISALLLHSGTEFLDETGFDAYYNYTEKNYKFTTAPTSGIVLYATGLPQIPVQALRVNTASINRYGRRELEISDSKIENLTAARQLAAAELSNRKDQRVVTTFSTYVTGLKAGLIVSLVLPSYGLELGDYFIQKVETKYALPESVNGKYHIYTVEAVNVLSKDFIDYLRDMFIQKKRRIDPAETEAVGDLTDHSENIGIADAHPFQTPTAQTEAATVADAHSIVTVASGGYKWSADDGTTADKLRWNLGDWG